VAEKHGLPALGLYNVPFTKLNISNLTMAIDRVLNDHIFSQNAQTVSEKLKMEDGVGKAIIFIQAFLD
jgi:UDP:flavonoid glycosyltransferase YjiC (YdhE family)